MTKNFGFKANTLTHAFLASTLFISTLSALPNRAEAAVLVINGSDQASCPIGNCGNNGSGGVEFQTDNTLIVQSGQNVGQTGGVSVTVTGTDNIGDILFKGTSTILGSVSTVGNILRLITLDSPGTVTANGDIRVTTVNLQGPGSNLLMLSGTDLTTTQINGSNINTVALTLQGTNYVTGNIGSAAGATQLNLTGATGIVTTTGNIFGPVQFVNSDQELIIANNKSITGTVLPTVSGKGTLTFQGSTIISEDIGTFSPDIYLRQVNFNGGIAVIPNSNLGHSLSALSVVVDACATLSIETLNYRIVTTNGLINSGIIQLGTLSNPVQFLPQGDYIGTPGSSLNMIVTSGGQAHSILDTQASSGNITIPENGMHIIVSGNTVPNNLTLPFLTTILGTITIPPGTPPSTATYEFIPIFTFPGGRTFLSYKFLTTPMNAYVGQDSLLSPIAQFFDTIGKTIQTSAPALVPVYDALNAQRDGCALTSALGNLALPVNGNLLAVYHGGTTRGFQVITERMDNNRGEFARGETRYKYAGFRDYCTNIPCDYSMRAGQWIEFYGSAIDRKDETLEGTGYTGRQWTLIAGYDKVFYPSFNAGMALAYSQLQTNSKGAINNHLEADSFQGYLYASHETCAGSYFDAIVSLAYNDYDQDREIDLLSGINLDPTPCGINAVPFGFLENPHGRFGGWQFNGYFEGGYQFRCNKFVIVPHGIFRTTYLRLNEFSETNAPIAGYKNVQYDDMQELELGGGLKVAKNYICCKKYKVTPYVKLIALHDFKNTPQRVRGEFIGGGSELLTSGFASDANSLTTTLGLTLNRRDNSFLTLEYDFEKRSDFAVYAAFLKYRVEWC